MFLRNLILHICWFVYFLYKIETWFKRVLYCTRDQRFSSAFRDKIWIFPFKCRGNKVGFSKAQIKVMWYWILYFLTLIQLLSFFSYYLRFCFSYFFYLFTLITFMVTYYLICLVFFTLIHLIPFFSYYL